MKLWSLIVISVLNIIISIKVGSKTHLKSLFLSTLGNLVFWEVLIPSHSFGVYNQWNTSGHMDYYYYLEYRVYLLEYKQSSKYDILKNAAHS